MAAPPAALITALRAGTVRRHLFFKMTHSQGTVFAWDGVGDFELDGETYLGVRGLASISGVSDSGELQNHEVTYQLNGVPLPALLSIDPYIRGETITLKAAWIDESGVALYQRTLRVDIADILTMSLDAETKTITVKARSPMAEWQTPPRAYYTDKDQQRRFPGDTGFLYVKELENTNVTGWTTSVETSGGIPRNYGSFDNSWFLDSVTYAPIGDHTFGLTPRYRTTDQKLYTNTYATQYVEQDTGASTGLSGTGYLTVGGVNTYVDAAGDVRTSGGKLIYYNGDTNHKLRVPATIASDGTATGTRITTQSGVLGTESGANVIRKEGVSVSGEDMNGLVFAQKSGRMVQENSGVLEQIFSGADFVEASTGNAVTFAGGVMQVSGSDVHVSTTGVILTAANRRIHKTGDTNDFLRVWT